MNPLQPSDIPGYDTLNVTFDDPQNRRDFEFLLARDHKTLLRIFHIDMNKDPYAEMMKSIDVNGRPTRGAKDAKVVAVTYDDFQCPFCSRMHATLFPTLLQEYGDRVLFIYKDFPLEDNHPWALHAAIDANCLLAQNVDAYWDFSDAIHSNQKEFNDMKVLATQAAALDKAAAARGPKFHLDATKLQACIKAQSDKAVRASQLEGQALGVTATPETFVNGRKIDGALPIDDIRAALDNALRDAGVAPPEHKATAGGAK
ncbi:MAG: thioredoxin domain-containing protein [Acidobacteria bacterium]|nr:thioredoxin domain-containing protein [Acidobacteriota bacterium]